ncbi:DUF2935 domain-containing protein [Sporomusa acidovorans]|uniref:DUF2935 domain-containing protein n=1 Tax=Sporomusa acidovorans (strain ATCC 49682 / DSM 3132 / Mol) TaxID=1123286 RepID=A0ABZ3IXC9_SPOA4|nr:DUF2935 domain-containing protein [Sporomusa acidovorans]OZC23398.1 hypothetical protein SPACI_08100 [Sporomusa acidovorans DSM 3132]SDE44309.1 protein of unknown function [Sporomusa acidovorans]
MDIFCREVKPFVPLNIHQVRFWLRIMKEHSLFIKLGLPCDQTELIQEADQFYAVFADLEKRACQIGSENDFLCFIDRVMTAVKNIFCFKRHLLHLLIECKIRGGANYPLLIDHISREAMYFHKILQKVKDGEMKYPVDSIVSENVFWLRIMGDHLKFIRGLLDPSERDLVDTSNALSDKFDQLQLHARDFDSMLWHFRITNDFWRFEKDVTTSTMQLRDFKATAEELIKECAALSLIPPLLADHVRREAEHFLEILNSIQSEGMECSQPDIFHCDHEF